MIEVNNVENIDATYYETSVKFAYDTMMFRLKRECTSQKYINYIKSISAHINDDNKMCITITHLSGLEIREEVMLNLHIMMRGIDDHLDSIWATVVSLLDFKGV